MNKREIARVGRACLDLAERAILLKSYLPLFACGEPDWPVIADDVRDLRRRFEKVESMLGETKPVRGDDLQWRLCKYDVPDADVTVLVSIAGHDDAHEAYRDASDDGADMIWRYANGQQVYGHVYAWTEMPPSLRVRNSAVAVLTNGATS